MQQESVTVSTESSKDIEVVTPQDLGPEVATSVEVVGGISSDQSATTVVTCVCRLVMHVLIDSMNNWMCLQILGAGFCT